MAKKRFIEIRIREYDPDKCFKSNGVLVGFMPIIWEKKRKFGKGQRLDHMKKRLERMLDEATGRTVQAEPHDDSTPRAL